MGLVALVFFKVVLAFILVVGLQLFGSHDGTQSVLLGSVMLLMVPILSWSFYQRVAGHNVQFLPGGMTKLQGAYTRFRG
jgi:hypothetical protein